jgi:REP element-mobilizing transposase RayT
MSQTHLALHYHVIFSTKERHPFIKSEWKDRLHSFLAGCIKAHGGFPEAIGGTKDHVHLLFGLKATHKLADVVKDIKVASSKWVHHEIGLRLFAWQKGYGGFTVGLSQIEQVRGYVLNQEKHHAKKNFKEEYVEMLKLAEIEYDEKFMWW